MASCRGVYLYLEAGGKGPPLDSIAERRRAALLYAQWLEGGKTSQADLARLLASFAAQHDALLDLAVAATNTAPRFALHAGRCAVLANAAAALSFPPVPPPCELDMALVCECLAAVACVFESRGANLFTAAALAGVTADFAARAQGAAGRDAATTALHMFARYWTARAHYECAAANAAVESMTVAELSLGRAHARLAAAILDAALAEWPAALFTAAGVDRRLFPRLRKDCGARDQALDQRLAFHQIRGLRLDDAAATAPPPLPASDVQLPVIDALELCDFDTQFTTEVIKARADMARDRAAAKATEAQAQAQAPPAAVSFEAARSHMLPILLGAGAEHALKIMRKSGGSSGGTVRVEMALMRAWLAEQQRIARMLLDPRPAANDWRQEVDGLVRELDAALARSAGSD